MVGRVEYIFGQDTYRRWSIQYDQIITLLEWVEDAFELLFSLSLSVKRDVQIAIGEIGRQQIQILIIGPLRWV